MNDVGGRRGTGAGAPVPGDVPERVVILSDLHIGAGRQADGRTDPLEHFHHDRELEALLDRVGGQAARRARRAELILNGDVFDFVRVFRLPASPAEVREWRSLLAAANVPIPVDTLRAAAAGRFSPIQRRYGYDCSEPASIWRLWLMARGHPRVLAGLARWCAAGHSLVVIRGNHDNEWAWPGVQRAFRILLARGGCLAIGPDQLRFRLHAYRRGNLWVEHGHFIRWSTRPPGVFAAGKPRRLIMPLGSVINRFVLNPLERLLDRAPGVPSSLHLKRLAKHQPWRLWLGVSRSALRSLPALAGATRRVWHHHARGFWPSYAGGGLGAAVLALPLLSHDLAASLALDSGYRRVGAAAVALTAPSLGAVLGEILSAARDTTRVQARGYALQRAGARAGRPDASERIVVLGHTHAPDLHRWKLDGGHVVYANPGAWMEDPGGQAAPRFFWCALRDGVYSRPRLLEIRAGGVRARSTL
ncbi:MAG: hypothetical protein ACLFRX_05655 [Gemmatimonadota bacterium]